MQVAVSAFLMANPISPPVYRTSVKMAPPLNVERLVSSTRGRKEAFAPRGTSVKIWLSGGGVLLLALTLYQPKSIWQPPPWTISVPVKLQRGENTAGLVSASVWKLMASPRDEKNVGRST